MKILEQRFMIRNSKGEYSTGGYQPTPFKKIGKVWKSIGAVRNHLNLVLDHGGIPDDWEIVTILLVDIDSKVSAKELQKARYEDRKARVDKESIAREKKYLEEQLVKIQERLKSL